jgi:hypothetical protein
MRSPRKKKGCPLKIAMGSAAAALCLGVAGHAAAEPGLGNKVYDPYVRNGLTEVEVRSARLTGGSDGGDATTVVELEKGLGDRVSLALLGEFEKHPSEAAKLDSVGLEGVVYLGQLPKLGIDTGLYVEYEQRLHNESGVGEAKLLLAKNVDRFQGLLNLIVQHPFTSRPGEKVTQFGYATSATWELAPGLRAGAEAFGNLGTNRLPGGRNAHYVGPTVRWEIRPDWLQGGEIEVQGGYLLAAGAARTYTDGQMRLNIEVERRF